MAEQKLPTDPKYDTYDFPTTSPESKAGHPGHTTPEQDAKVFQLRTVLEQEGYTERLDTLTILRFLRARQFDVEKSKLMFIETEKWRKEFGTDDLPRTFDYTEKAKVFEYYPQFYHKTDNDGRPVYIEKLGKINLNKMLEITTAERMLQNLVTEYEKLSDPRLPACSRKSGKLQETCCTIMDLKGIKVMSIPSAYSYLKQASAISQNYYPERLGKLYLINAPWGFSSAFSIIKSWLDPVTQEKIHVLGSDYAKTLLQQVPAENLPANLGGSCKCEGGCELSDDGPWQDSEWTRTPAWATSPEEKAVAKEVDAKEVDAKEGEAEAKKEETKKEETEAEAAVITNEDPGPEVVQTSA
ncbi:cytosolic factor phosphatidylinositol/phosphatidylcholine transfer protein [Penicillium taxi]|uniref:cytosolic factor phosphatidylinositol/phosphatidylcholine transfer protein n=1 Tax=Penicillium taxi TaxID=168475 RepID=UPI002544F3D3|nr:cytosolic factor phosphatidylinositol/phosphatidylcholine transfer protein [Penicillium taxi]KAJ5888136.1 cytosolic factor phosphatidylinositol/phosphatidylcholine transfer protein [Penicillium taxi]